MRAYGVNGVLADDLDLMFQRIRQSGSRGRSAAEEPDTVTHRFGRVFRRPLSHKGGSQDYGGAISHTSRWTLSDAFDTFVPSRKKLRQGSGNLIEWL